MTLISPRCDAGSTSTPFPGCAARWNSTTCPPPFSSRPPAPAPARGNGRRSIQPSHARHPPQPGTAVNMAAPGEYATLGLRIRLSCARLRLHISKQAKGGTMVVSSNVSDIIERDIFIAAPAEKVWEVVSIPVWWINDGSALDLSLIERITQDRAIVDHAKHGDLLAE